MQCGEDNPKTRHCQILLHCRMSHQTQGWHFTTLHQHLSPPHKGLLCNCRMSHQTQEWHFTTLQRHSTEAQRTPQSVTQIYSGLTQHQPNVRNTRIYACSRSLTPQSVTQMDSVVTYHQPKVSNTGIYTTSQSHTTVTVTASNSAATVACVQQSTENTTNWQDKT